MALTFPAGYASANPAAVARTEQFFLLLMDKATKVVALAELVAQGICLEARDQWGNTALILAVIYDHTATAQALLAAGAEIEARDNDGYTALIEAAYWGNTATLQALLARGANIYARSPDDKRPIDDPKLSSHVASWPGEYAEFVAGRHPPEDAAAVYRLLAATPLLDENAPVDRIGNLTRIMAHAQWAEKSQPAAILSEMAADGSITPEMARSIYQHHIATPAARRTPTPSTGRSK